MIHVTKSHPTKKSISMFVAQKTVAHVSAKTGGRTRAGHYVWAQYQGKA